MNAEELKIVITAEVGKLKQSVKEAKESIKGLDSSTNNTIKNMGNTINKGLTTAFSAAKKGAIAFGTAVGGIVIASTKNFAEFEQLVGGVEKLFGDSANTVQKYASAAYKSAGLDANAYMEQITSFSASLISSLNGDTTKAAEVGNMAINDMADNANVFGTSIESIQNAYQGFAKQNYTMLDNLKLGYGGTKEEMQRLLEEAEKLSGIKYDINNLSDVYEAIHVIQTELKITGTTSKEAMGTISGSIAMTKSAWSNLMTGLANDNANIPELVKNVVSSGTAVLDNIIPVAKEVLKSIPEAIAEVNPEVGAAVEGIISVIASIAETAWPVIEEAVTMITDIIGFLSEHTGLLEAIAIAIGVVTAAVEAYNIAAGIKAAMDAAEVTTLGALIAAKIACASATLVALAPYLLIVAAIAAVIAIIVVCVKHWDEIKEKVSEVWEKIKQWTIGAVEAVKQKFTDMKEAISAKITAAKEKVTEVFTNMKQAVVDKVNAIKQGIVDKFNAIKDGIKEKIEAARDFVKNAIDKIKNFFKFDWKLPKLKMPHLKIEGEFSLLPPKVPKFSIDWYAKGGVFNNPTLFSNGGRLAPLLEQRLWQEEILVYPVIQIGLH